MKVGFFGLLFLVFLVLKLTGTIAWSWWWVTAPLWGGFAFVGLVGVISFAVLFIATMASTPTKRKKK